MPNHSDEERLTQRLNELEDIIKGEWPKADIKRVVPQESGEPQRIRIEIDRSQEVGRNRVAMIFKTRRPLMIDTDSPVERVFQGGIKLAHEIFSAPPNEDKILQGTVIMTSREVSFERYSGSE